MTYFLKNTSIFFRINLLCLLPLLALVGLSLHILLQEKKRMDEASAIAEIVALAPVISGLVHELQKERGTSAGFLGSQGKKFATAIHSRRADTDKALRRFQEVLSTAAAELTYPDFQTPYARAKQALARLADKRRAVDAFEMTVAQMAGYYTPLIANLLAMVESVKGFTDDGKIVRALTAYTALLEGKERAGLERAMGATGFGSGQFKPAIYRNFLRLGAMQDTYFELFRQNASPKQRASFQQALAGAVTGDVQAMRALAEKAPFGGDISTVTGAQWFAASTRRIDALKKVEDGLAQDIVTMAHDIAAKASQTFWLFLGLFVGFLALSGYLTYVIATSITHPIQRLTREMRELARNKTDMVIQDQERQDELGEMARAVEIFRENAIARIKLEKAAQYEHQKEAERQKRIEKLINDFNHFVSETRSALENQTETMRRTAKTLSLAASGAAAGADSASAAAQKTSENVQTVATATEELSASMQEIAAQIGKANEVVGAATRTTADTEKDVASLSEAVDKIGTVVSLIQDIAEQTNLLALNATIEAARAGDAGKGFAVVAQEVKQLSEQTAKATDEIATQISAIQNSTKGAVAAVQTITQQIEDINAVTLTIASAVEQQQAATQEISNSIQIASDETNQAAHDVQTVTDTIGETSREADMLLSISDALAEASSQLASTVDKFLSDVSQDVAERRSALREKMSQAVVICSAGRRHHCTILDASTTGAKITCSSRLAVGDKVAMELADGTTVEAKVVRDAGDGYGIAFDTPLESLDWLKLSNAA